MHKTSLESIIDYCFHNTEKIFHSKLHELGLNILCILLGFFISTSLSTIPGQTGDWGIIGAAIIVGFYELVSQKIYLTHASKNIPATQRLNNMKVGIIYGLFVDAFKLGS
uniref:Uncharacterized protein ycf20 n=1 Tax=Scinaia undulata TaxID=1884664 RepID=A0A1G4NXJ1_9FLOR|nr:Hypothetical protein ycf20 [Scinaia undulata]SCW23355.1 Hypothetical protein ycf20 [Scinaia undulata]